MDALRLVAERFPDKADRICRLPAEEPAKDFLDGSLAPRGLGFQYRPARETFLDMAGELLDITATQPSACTDA